MTNLVESIKKKHSRGETGEDRLENWSNTLFSSNFYHFRYIFE